MVMEGWDPMKTAGSSAVCVFLGGGGGGGVDCFISACTDGLGMSK